MLNTVVAVSGVGVIESVTWTVALNVPLAVATPAMYPYAVTVRPAGNDPDTSDHV